MASSLSFQSRQQRHWLLQRNVSVSGNFDQNYKSPTLDAERSAPCCYRVQGILNLNKLAGRRKGREREAVIGVTHPDWINEPKRKCEFVDSWR
jgi:hypothetical protein